MANYIVIDTCSEKRPLTTKTAPALHHLFLYQVRLLRIPLIGSSQLLAKHFPYLYPSTPILRITSTLYAYEDGTDSKYRNVGTKSSGAGRLLQRHNTVRHVCLPVRLSAWNKPAST